MKKFFNALRNVQVLLASIVITILAAGHQARWFNNTWNGFKDGFEWMTSNPGPAAGIFFITILILSRFNPVSEGLNDRIDALEERINRK